MMNRRSKFLLTITLASLSLGVIALSSINKPVLEVKATQHADNFKEYDYESYSGTYYNSISSSATEGLNGTLRTSLTALIHPAAWYDYSSGLANILQSADEDPTNSNNMILFYTRDSVKKNAASNWNREHCWPQSKSGGCWGTGQGGGSDLLHIRPTYSTPNSTRGSLSYGEVTGGKELTYNGMKYGYSGNGNFMPLDSVKGDAARIIMYTWVAYKNHYGSLPNITNVFESYDTLLTWHTNDKPDVMEAHRNDVAESSNQKNRNPFIDHPEYAWKIFGDECSAAVKEACKDAYPEGGKVAPTSLTVSPENVSLVKDGTQRLTVTANKGASNSVSWSSSNTSVATVSSGLVTAIGEGTCTITATSTLAPSVKCYATINVREYSSLTLEGEPTTKKYSDGDTFDPTGLTVKAQYDGGEDIIENSQCEWKPNPLVEGTTTVTVHFSGLSASYTGITVDKAIIPTKITINGNATGISSLDGNQTITCDGVTLKGHFKKYLTSAIWFSSGKGYIYNTTSLGKITKITLNYRKGGSASAVQYINLDNKMMSSHNTNKTHGTSFSTSTGDTSNSFTPSGEYGFFNISVTSKNLQVDSIIIETKSKSERTLTSLTLSGEANKKIYYDGDSFDPTGLTVTANYSNSDTQDVTEDVTWSPDPLQYLDNQVTASYTEKDVTKEVTYSDITVYNTTDLACYKRVTEAEDDFTGEYTFIDEGQYVTMGWDGTSNVKNTVTVNLENDQIRTKPDSLVTLIAQKIEDSNSYSLKIRDGENDGKYLTKGTLLEFAFSDTPDAFNISIDNENKAEITHVSSGCYIVSSSLNFAFGLLKINTFSLFKASELAHAKDFSKSFIKTLTCDNGITAPNKDVWNRFMNEYNAMNEISKDFFRYGETKDTDVLNALDRYDYIIRKYGATDYPNYIGRDVTQYSQNTLMINGYSVLIFVLFAIFAGSISVLIVCTNKKKKINR